LPCPARRDRRGLHRRVYGRGGTRAAGPTRARRSRVASLRAAHPAGRPQDRPRSVHRRADRTQHWDVGPLHSPALAPLLPQQVRLCAGRLSGRALELRAVDESSLASRAHRSRRRGRHRGGAARGADPPPVTTPRFAWVGFHAEGLPALHALLGAGAPIGAVLTLTPELRAKRSGGVDYAPLCAEYRVPLHCISGINEPDAYEVLHRFAPDIIFVIGWHQIVRPPVMRLARRGLIGAH